MSITITFSSTNGGGALSAPISYGNVANGNVTVDQTIYISHNGVNPITGVGIYLDIPDIGTYAGDATALADRTELLSWGDAISALEFGGCQLNLNAIGSFPSSSWPTFGAKTTSDTFGANIRTGFGDNIGNAIVLPTATGATSPGTIQVGASPNVRFKVRIQAPSTLNTLGARQFRLKLTYNYTS